MSQTEFDTDALMGHVRHLAERIGPRPSTSEQEREAAAYVRKTLTDYGITGIEEQPFESHGSIGDVQLPMFGLAALAFPVSWLLGRLGKLIGGVMLLVAAQSLINSFRARAPFFEKWITRNQSQNIITRIAPTGDIRRRVVIVGHLDSQKKRDLFPQHPLWMNKPFNTFGVVMLIITGVSMIWSFISGCKRPKWHSSTMGTVMQTLWKALKDENNGHVDGANDNATAVAVTLEMARRLQDAPLKNTEVTLLFTGCEEVGCVGMEAYLREKQPPHNNTYFIDIEMVGTGDICYVTQHGISYLTPYSPGPQITALAARTARENPGLAVTGRPMLILEEVSNIRDHGYEGICVAGYGDDGHLPNWHRMSDTVANIQPETLTRAAHYVDALTRAIDADAG